MLSTFRPGFTAQSLPDLRNRLIEHLRSDLAHRYTAAMMEGGQGTLRPATDDSELAAALLHRDEIRRLRKARLFFLTHDVTQHAVTTGSRLPRDQWDLQAQDPPADAGFLVFQTPIAAYPNSENKTVQIVGASWGGTRLVNNAAGIWVTFWSRILEPQDSRPVVVDGIQVSAVAPPLYWDNEVFVSFGRSIASLPDTPTPVGPGTFASQASTIDWFATLFAAWAYAKPNGLTETRKINTPRPAAGRKGKKRPASECRVNVVSVNRKPAQTTANNPGDARGPLDYRMEIAAYLRRQPHGPRREQRRWQLVSGYTRGPEGAPLRLSKTVTRVDQSPDASLETNEDLR